jgi:hypothetical protein
MTTISYGFIPYDPETENTYINSVGSSEVEASINLDLVGLSIQELLRIKFLPCEIHYDKPPTEENT